MGKGRTLVRGTLLLTVSGLALRALGVLFQAILAGRIGAEGMGVLQLILTVGGFAGTLGSAGVRVAALQLTARAWGKRDPAGIAGALWACLRYGLLVSAAVGLNLFPAFPSFRRAYASSGCTWTERHCRASRSFRSSGNCSSRRPVSSSFQSRNTSCSDFPLRPPFATRLS